MIQQSNSFEFASSPKKLAMRSADFEPTLDSIQSEVSKQTLFKQQREKYIAQRKARKREAVQLVKKEFNDNSSDEQTIKQTEPARQSKAKIVKKSSMSQAASSLTHSIGKMEPIGLLSGSTELTRKTNNQLQQSTPTRVKLCSNAALKIDNQTKKKPSCTTHPIIIASKKGLHNWIEESLSISPSAIVFPDRSLPLYDVSKIKLVMAIIQGNAYRMKICGKEDDQTHLGAEKTKNTDAYYRILSNVVVGKLTVMGRGPLNKHKIESSQGIPEGMLSNNYIFGKILKSGLFGKWSSYLGIINSSGLSLYKKPTQKASHTIPFGSVKELWTRFQIVDGYLQIKLSQNGSKIELAIPIEDYLNDENWLYWIYRLAWKQEESG